VESAGVERREIMPHSWWAYNKAKKIVELLKAEKKESGRVKLDSKSDEENLQGRIQIILEED
jgi:hypothetical protein